MSKKKSVTLSVHRAIIADEFPWTLASLLENLKSEGNIQNYIVDRGLFDKTAVKFPPFPKTNQAVAAQFALYEEGAKKSTINTSGATETYSTTPLTAPEKEEFLDHEVAILVEGNFMIACGIGKRLGLLVDAIGKIASSCNVEMPPASLSFANTPNKLTVQKIRSVGVRSINFDASNFLGSLDISTKSLIGSIFGSSASFTEFQKEEMVADLSIYSKRSTKAKLETVKATKNEWLEKAAVKTFQDDDVSSFTIVLDDGTEWKEGDLKLSRSVNIARDGSTFSMPEALQAMLDYLAELKAGGHLR